MFKKIVKSKKTVTAVICAAALAAASGGTYAWFTSKPDNNLVVDMGTLKIATTLTPDENNPTVIEPGVDLREEGIISNMGSVPCAVVVDYTALVTIKSDDNGNELKKPYVVENDENVTLEFDESRLGYSLQADEDWYMWFAVDGQDGRYVLMMSGDVEPEVAYDVALNGPGMGNKYQRAEISFTAGWNATQVLEPAISDVLGVDISDLIVIDNDLDASGNGFGRMAFSKKDVIEAKVAELLAR